MEKFWLHILIKEEDLYLVILYLIAFIMPQVYLYISPFHYNNVNIFFSVFMGDSKIIQFI